MTVVIVWTHDCNTEFVYQNWGKNVYATPHPQHNTGEIIGETQRGSVFTTCGTGVTVSGKVASL